MDTKALRQKVLDLAIRGKLVPQDPNDEPASVLLERIRQEKLQMVKEGKLKAKDIKNDSVIFKGDDNLHYEKFADGTVECIENEIPFDIPDSWEWCRLNDLFFVRSSKRVLKSEWKKSGVPFYRAREIARLSESGFVNNELFISQEHYTTLKKEYGVPNAGDLMITGVGTIGKVYVVKTDDTFYYKDASVLCFENRYNAIDPFFAKYLIESTVLQSQIHNKTYGNTVDTITIQTASNYLCLLPPTNEQKRIVNTIEKAISHIKHIGESQTELAEIISLLKSKILDLAIRGKLVPQNPNDEPVSVLLERIRAEKEELIKQGKIKRDKNESVIFKGEDNSYYEKIVNSIICIDDELPYEIPGNWTYIRLKDILEYEQPTPYIVDSTAYCNDYETPVLTAGKSFVIGYTNETEGIKNDLPVIIFDDFTTESKYVDFPFKVKSSAMKILTADERVITTLYAYYAMQIVECDSENHKRYWISEFSEKIIGLPPLEEQFRIINRIKEIESLFE